MVSIIMPTYNKCKYLELTLCGFINQTYKDFQIIIIDDGSTDATYEIVNSFVSLLNINYVYQNNQGRAAARNKGLSLVTGDYIIFCDDDRIPSRSLIEEHILILMNDKKIVTIGYKKEILTVLRNNKTYQIPFIFDILKKYPDILKTDYYEEDIQLFSRTDITENIDKILKTNNIIEGPDNFHEVYEYFDKNLKNFYFGWVLGTTANLGIRYNDIASLSFDEQYKNWGMEDTNFSYDLYKRGFNFYLAEGAINYHQIHDKESNYHNSLLRNIKYFYVKYNNIETALFALLILSNISIIEINNLFDFIKNDTSNKANISLMNVVQKLIKESKFLNNEYLS